MSEFRRLLVAACKRLWDGNIPGLLFSGGSDSLSVLWSLLELGARPVCYTFHLQGQRHADVVVSEKVARAEGLQHEVVIIPRDVARLERDVRELVRRTGGARKTHIQCLYPLLHLTPAIAERQVFTGLNADDWWGTAASDAINCSKNRAEFDRRRRKRQADPKTSGWQFWDALMTEQGHELCCPYRDPAVVKYLLSKSWPELNKPRQKAPLAEGFTAEFQRHKCWRKNDNLQCGSGIREWHDVLLKEPVNKLGRTRVQDLYRDILEGRA